MRSVHSTSIALAALALAWSSTAHADDDAQRELRPTQWEVAGHMGYGHAWTIGLDPYQYAVGLSAGLTTKPFLFVGLRAMHHYGQSRRGDGPGTSYRAYDATTSFDLQGAADWRALPWLDIRPGLATGLDYIGGYTMVGRTTVVDRRLTWSFGPYIRALVHARRSFGYGPYRGPFVGVEGDARFAPNQPAAPRGGVFLIWGATF